VTILSNLIGRNLKLYFRDRTSVFFSLLSVFIIVGMYALFLGNVMVKSLQDLAGENARFLIDSWVMAGVLAVTSMTTTMGAFGTMVQDRSKKISRDFAAAPIKRSQLAAGYIISSLIIGMIMTTVALVIAEIYIVAFGGMLITIVPLLKVLGIMVLSVFCSSSLLFFIVSFFRTSNSFTTVSIIIGTIIGFITGIYIPTGSLPEAVQTFIKIFPVSHAGALFRQVMMEASMSKAFTNAPVQAIDGFKKTMGIVFYAGSKQLSPIINILIITGAGILFYILSVIRISMKKKY